MLNRVWPFVTPWTVACQAPLTMRFSRQEYWSGLPCSPPGDLPSQGSNPGLPPYRWILYHLSHPGSPSISLNLAFSLKWHHRLCFNNLHCTVSITSRKYLQEKSVWKVNWIRGKMFYNPKTMYSETQYLSYAILLKKNILITHETKYFGFIIKNPCSLCLAIPAF